MTRGTKVLNQNIFSPVVYGGETSGDDITINASSSALKGPVRVIGSLLELNINSQTGQIIHANSAPRLYTLPDVSGTLFCSGSFTAANQLVFGAAAGIFGILDAVGSSILTTAADGTLGWTSGVDGQVMTLVSGVPSFQTLPNNGTIATGYGNTLPVYQSPGPSKKLTPLTTVSNRALLSTPSSLSWSLVSAPYLLGGGGIALTTGSAGQVLSSLGDGSFTWVVQNTSQINSGAQYYLPFYNTPGTGTTISSSSFLSVDESVRAVKLENQGRMRFLEATLNGTQYVELRAPSALTSNVSFLLPSADGVAGSSLTTDGSGALSFTLVNNGKVNSGTSNQVTYYAANGNTVSGLPTAADRILTSASGVLGWNLLTAPYLSGIGGPLSNGTSNQVLISNGAGSFSWTTATDLTGTVLTGVANYLAYYPATGTQVDDTSFLSIDNTGRVLNLENGAALKIFQPAVGGSNYIQFNSPSVMTASVVFTLPGMDGSVGQALLTDSSGNLSFQTVGRGIVDVGTANTFSYYPNATAEVASFPNTPERVAVTTGSNVISWGLLSTKYMLASGGLPLDIGSLANVLISNGDGSFQWADVVSITGKVDPGTVNRLAYYGDATTLESSAFIETVEPFNLLNLLDGELRLCNSTHYVGLASPTLTNDTTYMLPSADGIAGEVMTTDGSGNMSWSSQVELGSAQPTLAYYDDSTRNVSPTYSVTLTVSSNQFSIDGKDGASVSLTAGSGTDFSSHAGVDGVWHAGVVSDQLTLSTASASFVDVVLALTDSSTGKSAGFRLNNPPADIIWSLPPTDGSAGQVLTTDSLGGLGWSTASGTISSGSVGALAVYTGPTTVGSSALLAPAAVPGTNQTSLIVDTSGSLSYQMLVTPSGSAGNVALYTAGQTVGYEARINFDTALNTFVLGDGGKVKMISTAGSTSVSLTVPSTLASTYILTLPANSPANGDILVSDSLGNLTFQSPDASKLTQQRGVITVRQNVEEATVMFSLPFADKPKVVVAQWAMTDTSLPAFLPTIAVDQASFEGFVLQFSTMTPITGTQYTIYWEAYQNGDTAVLPLVYFAGGEIGSGLTSDIKMFSMDNDTGSVSFVSTTTPIGYAAAASSLTTGYLLGGVEGVSSVAKISTLDYNSNTFTDNLTSLPVNKSSACAVGTKNVGYVAGGENIGSGSLSSIDKIVYSTDTVTTLAAALTADAIRRGGATSRGFGYVVDVNPTSTVEILSYSNETVSAGPSNFSTASVQVGCNDNGARVGYFAKNTGLLYSYIFASDTITSLPAALTSGAGVGGAGNSMRNGYFVNGANLEALSFRTGTTSVVNSVSDTYVGGSTGAFQSGGLL